jgi:hypothetical protein
MSILASFNGGPSETAVLFAFIASGMIGLVAGLLLRRPGVSFLVGFVVAAIACGMILIGGNKRGDAAGFFLSTALMILCPVCGLLGGVLAALSGWFTGRVTKHFQMPAGDHTAGDINQLAE